MHEQLQLPLTDQTPYTPYYSMWRVLFLHDKKLKFMTPQLATHLLVKADFDEDDIAAFLKRNTSDCPNCKGEGHYDPNVCHGFGARRKEFPCLQCHQTGTVFTNVPHV